MDCAHRRPPYPRRPAASGCRQGSPGPTARPGRPACGATIACAQRRPNPPPRLSALRAGSRSSISMRGASAAGGCDHGERQQGGGDFRRRLVAIRRLTRHHPPEQRVEPLGCFRPRGAQAGRAANQPGPDLFRDAGAWKGRLARQQKKQRAAQPVDVRTRVGVTGALGLLRAPCSRSSRACCPVASSAWHARARCRSGPDRSRGFSRKNRRPPPLGRTPATGSPA